MMSGTSFDGVDAAMIETDGEEIIACGPSAYRPYTQAEQAVLRAAQGLWPGQSDAALARASALVLDAHLQVLARLPRADLVGFHGQTLAHDPAGGRTHQAGDGAALARASGMRTVWDFRSPDMAAGGQGAPLVPFYHVALARRAGLTGRVAFLNLGGVANLTLADMDAAGPEAPGALTAFDTGPGNALLNDLLRARRGQGFDRDGALAATGRADRGLVRAWLADPWFDLKPPKSLDRDAFARVLGDLATLRDADAAASLTLFAAAAVARGLAVAGAQPGRLILCGGGRRNPVLTARIAAETGVPAGPIEDLGHNGDMTEAEAFAFLAARASRGLQLTAPGTTGRVRPAGPPRIDG